VYDNHSTDNSVQIAKSFGAKVVPFGKAGQLNDADYLTVKNSAKPNDEWVIVCDADELLYHPKSLRNAIEEEIKLGTTYLNVKGFNIYSDLGVNNVEKVTDIQTGFPYPPFDKKICFDARVLAPNYAYGAHNWKPKGKIQVSASKFYLLHYRCIGGVQRMIDRHAEYAKRMSQFNKNNRLSFHYLRSPKEIMTEWDENVNKMTTFKPF
jgi:glycosyltransferase involved in cell wall biosynthesis